jgi:hypothetical protein
MEENQFTNNSTEITNAAIIFARALSLILQNNEGIIVDVPETIKESFETLKVVILKTNDKVSIFNFDRDLAEGTSVSLSENNEQ